MTCAALLHCWCGEYAVYYAMAPLITQFEDSLTVCLRLLVYSAAGYQRLHGHHALGFVIFTAQLTAVCVLTHAGRPCAGGGGGTT
jgi:hypothetical protein